MTVHQEFDRKFGRKEAALAASMLLVLGLGACGTDNLRPGAKMRDYYTACAGAWVSRDMVEEAATAHCKKHDRKAVFDYVKRNSVCGAKQASTDAYDAYYRYNCRK